MNLPVNWPMWALYLLQLASVSGIDLEQAILKETRNQRLPQLGWKEPLLIYEHHRLRRIPTQAWLSGLRAGI